MRPAYAHEAPAGSPFALLRGLATRLPQFPPSAASALALNLLLREVVESPALDPARGKRVRVEIPDVGLALSYRVHHSGVSASAGGEPDVTIIADSEAMWSLVSGREDADMLFFSRRLVMTGDTELGLLIRNTLDAIDRAKVLRLRVPRPGEVVRALRETLDVPCGTMRTAPGAS